MSVAKNTTNLTIRLDSDLKKDCEALYAELGMSLSTAINVFLRQSLRKGGLPFDARLDDQPNRTPSKPCSKPNASPKIQR